MFFFFYALRGRWVGSKHCLSIYGVELFVHLNVKWQYSVPQYITIFVTPASQTVLAKKRTLQSSVLINRQLICRTILPRRTDIPPNEARLQLQYMQIEQFQAHIYIESVFSCSYKNPNTCCSHNSLSGDRGIKSEYQSP